MTTRRLPLPIRSLVVPARIGRRQRLVASVGSSTAACVRFVKSNLAAARVTRPVWLVGPLFSTTRLQTLVPNVRNAG
jgi:hypothetical protein